MKSHATHCAGRRGKKTRHTESVILIYGISLFGIIPLRCASYSITAQSFFFGAPTVRFHLSVLPFLRSEAHSHLAQWMFKYFFFSFRINKFIFTANVSVQRTSLLWSAMKMKMPSEHNYTYRSRWQLPHWANTEHAAQFETFLSVVISTV